MDKELINEIDKLIDYLIKNRNIHNLVPETEKEKDAFYYLKGNGFFENSNTKGQYKPSTFAYKLHELGAEKYFKKVRDNEVIEGKIKRKTLFDLNNKHFIRFCYLILGGLITWILNTEKSKRDNAQQENKPNNQGKVIDSMRYFLIQKDLKILSLKKRIDSLTQ